MSYDQLLGFVFGLYRIPSKTLDMLQKTFLITLVGMMVLVFLSNIPFFEPTESYLNLSNAIYFGLLLIAYLLSIPFQLASIRTSLDKKGPVLLSETLSPTTISDYMVLLAAILGISALALLPYGIAYKLVLDDMQAINNTSNILLAIRMFTLIAGMLAVLYASSKLLGALVYSQNGNNLSLSQVFAKFQGHFFATLVVAIAMVAPIEAIAQFIIYSLSGLKNIADSAILDMFVLGLQTFVRSVAILLQLYYLMSGITTYMKKVGLV